MPSSWNCDSRCNYFWEKWWQLWEGYGKARIETSLCNSHKLGYCDSCPTANQNTQTFEVLDENDRLVDEEAAGGKETDSSINVSSDWGNRIHYIPHICWVQMLVCEISNIAMNFWSAGVWAHLPNLPKGNWMRSLRMKRWPTKVEERFRSKRMARRTSIQIIPVQYSILFSKQSTTNFPHLYLDGAVRQQNDLSIRQSTDDGIPGSKSSHPGLPGTNFLAHQVRSIWFNVRRWLWYTDNPEALVVDKMGLGKTFTWVAAVMFCKLVTGKVVMGLPLCIL